jgi:hypothetical protein
LALVIFLYALSFLVLDKNRLKFILISIVSAMFHYSAIIPLVLLTLGRSIFNRSFKTIHYVLFALLSCALYYSNIASKLLSLAYGRYASYIDYTVSVSFLKTLVLNLFALSLIAYRKHYVKGIAETYMLNMIVFGTFITNIFVDFVPMTRLSYYFLIAQIVLVPKIIYSSRYNAIRTLFLFTFLFYYILMFSYALKIDIDLDQYPKLTPYKNYFFNDPT